MTVETASYVGEFNLSYPATGDKKVQGDNHLRLIKSCTANSFPNVTGVVSAGPSEVCLFHKGGTVSGSLTVKGDLSISGSLYTKYLTIDSSASASPTTSGRIMYHSGHEVLKLGIGSATITFPNDDLYMTARNPILLDQNSSATTASKIIGGNYGYIKYQQAEGESWISGNSYVLPSGHYEVDFKAKAKISATGTIHVSLRVLGDNPTYNFLEVAESYLNTFSTRTYNVRGLIYNTSTIEILANIGGSGSIDFTLSDTPATRLTLRRL